MTSNGEQRVTTQLLLHAVTIAEILLHNAHPVAVGRQKLILAEPLEQQLKTRRTCRATESRKPAPHPRKEDKTAPLLIPTNGKAGHNGRQNGTNTSRYHKHTDLQNKTAQLAVTVTLNQLAMANCGHE